MQARLARHLRAKRPDDPITVAVIGLGQTEAWQRSIEYRGDWVHDQAPMVEGIGHSFDRNALRWKPLQNVHGAPVGHQLNVGGGDPHSTTIGSILADAIEATAAFLKLAAVVLEEYIALLRGIGVHVTPSRGATSITVFSAADEAPEDAADEQRSRL